MNSQSHAEGPVLEVAGLTKSYGPVRALRGVSFALHAGEILCVCGPNGAGKTTLLEIVQGSRQPDSGSIAAFGYGAPFGQSIRARVGVLFQDGGAPDKCRVRELLGVFQSAYPDPLSVDEALTAVGLQDSANQFYKALSGGQRRRVLLATAIIGRPEVLMLDEPTSGLDPESREVIWSTIVAAARSGAGVLVTTHHLEEADDYCDRVVLLAEGNIVVEGPPKAIVRDRGLKVCCVLPAATASRARALPSFAGAVASRVGGGRFYVYFADKAAFDRFVTDAREHFASDGEMVARAARLEDLMLLAGTDPASMNGKEAVHDGQRR